eukprot:344207-Pyramimonas_sp.AAC.1
MGCYITRPLTPARDARWGVTSQSAARGGGSRSSGTSLRGWWTASGPLGIYSTPHVYIRPLSIYSRPRGTRVYLHQTP